MPISDYSNNDIRDFVCASDVPAKLPDDTRIENVIPAKAGIQSN